MTDDRIAIVVEMNQRAWDTLAYSLDGVTDEESRWQIHPAANTIEAIVRHLRIESEWHLNGLLRGDVMPFGVSPERQREIDAVTLDFNPNRDALVRSGAAFVKQLLAMTPPVLRERTAQTYDGKAEQTPHLLAYHQAMHLMTHCGQIRSIRNLYRRTRGERARFHPENPTYPGGRPDARRDEDAGPAIP
ncbi:MAG TPA: DUF664 domain-containing protein [Vicinamibacterales bacterium]|nr:DUF664 domain-containing protein [Vicinamibacterales bacterium]